MTASKRWEELSPAHSSVVERARRNSRLTIPGLIPEEGHSDTSPLADPFQSLGGRGVNNLASKLLLTLFPPNTANYRLQLSPDVVAQFEGTSRGELEEALAALETDGVRNFEAARIRNKLFQIIRLLIVSGSVLTKSDTLSELAFWRVDQFRMLRDPSGQPLEAVTMEEVAREALPEEVLEGLGASPSTKTAKIYTHVKWDYKAKRVSWHQEVGDNIIPKSESDVPFAKNPWNAPRWNALAGEDYGRSHVDDYAGDLVSFEVLSEAVVSWAEVAAKILYLVHPNSSTDPDDLADAESGDFVHGVLDDIGVLQLEKFADFQVARAVMDDLKERLSQAFLLTGGQVRDAERVTAEEIRMLAQELDDALGGTYTVLVEVLVQHLVEVNIREVGLPGALGKHIQPVVVTGFEALGRNHSVQKLRAFLSDAIGLLGEQTVIRRLNDGEVMKRLGTGHGIEDLRDLIKTDEQVAAADEEAMTQGVLGAAGPGIAQSIADQALNQ